LELRLFHHRICGAPARRLAELGNPYRHQVHALRNSLQHGSDRNFRRAEAVRIFTPREA
jgi:hypothetical protein